MDFKTPFTTPILFIVFNRPEPTSIVFARIREIKPQQLFIAADGPRINNTEDKIKCEEVQQIVKKIDWDCNVHYRFLENNLGCGVGVSSAITWFFENVEEGIILEDDCLPSYSFFYFCSELLEKYRNNPKIMHISGDNFQYGRKRGKHSYYFSHYTHNWGWATWKRAWNHYDFNLIPPEWNTNNWDKQWELSVEKNNGLSILPNQNLVRNFGFNEEATHTKQAGRYSNLEEKEFEIRIQHPKRIKVNKSADAFTKYTHFLNKNPNLVWFYMIKEKILGFIVELKIIIKRLLKKQVNY